LAWSNFSRVSAAERQEANQASETPLRATRVSDKPNDRAKLAETQKADDRLRPQSVGGKLPRPSSAPDEEHAIYIPGFRDELKTPRFWALIGLAVVCILMSAILSEHIHIDMLKAQIEGVDPRTVRIEEETTEVIAAVLREVGFASFIALVIGILVELSARQKHVRESNEILRRASVKVEETINRVSNGVFEAVLGVNLPPVIVEHALNTIFRVSAVRRRHGLSYTLKPLPDGYPDKYPGHLLLEVTSKYELINITGRDVHHEIRAILPLCAVPGLRPLCKVTSFAINDQTLSEKQVSDGQSEDAGPNNISYLWTETLRANVPLSVVVTYSIIKEKSDSEVFTILLPTEEVDLAVDVQVRGLDWEAESQHGGKLILLGAKKPLGRHDYISRQPILPHQGISVWWRPIIETPAPPSECLDGTNEKQTTGEELRDVSPVKGSGGNEA